MHDWVLTSVMKKLYFPRQPHSFQGFFADFRTPLNFFIISRLSKAWKISTLISIAFQTFPDPMNPVIQPAIFSTEHWDCTAGINRETSRGLIVKPCCGKMTLAVVRTSTLVLQSSILVWRSHCYQPGTGTMIIITSSHTQRPGAQSATLLHTMN